MVAVVAAAEQERDWEQAVEVVAERERRGRVMRQVRVREQEQGKVHEGREWARAGSLVCDR